jgi:hypothetical protein
MADLTFQQLEALVAQAGGTPSQQTILAGIAEGVESGGNPTAQNPTSTASGLWQELTSTWLGNGGGRYAPVAKEASPLDQAIVAVQQSVNGYQPWAPDLGGNYYSSNPALSNPQAPLPGSPVANYLEGAPAGGTTPASPSSANAQQDLDLNPLNGFGIPAAVERAGGSAIASGILGVIDTVLTPLKTWLTDSLLIVFGLVFLLVGLIVLVHSSGGSAPKWVPAGQAEEGASGGEAEEAGAAAA